MCIKYVSDVIPYSSNTSQLLEEIHWFFQVHVQPQHELVLPIAALPSPLRQHQLPSEGS